MREFLEMLVKAPTTFTYSIIKWIGMINPHKVFICCVVQICTLLLIAITYTVSPNATLLGMVGLFGLCWIALIISYFLCDKPQTKDDFIFILTGKGENVVEVQEDNIEEIQAVIIGHKDEEAKEEEEKVADEEITAGESEKIEHLVEFSLFEDEKQATTQEQESNGHYDKDLVAEVENILPKVNVEPDKNDVEEKTSSSLDKILEESTSEYQKIIDAKNEESSIKEDEKKEDTQSTQEDIDIIDDSDIMDRMMKNLKVSSKDYEDVQSKMDAAGLGSSILGVDDDEVI